VAFSLSRAGASPFRALLPPLTSVEAVDDLTIRIRTAVPSPDLPTLLYLPFIMSKPWAERHGAFVHAPFDDAELGLAALLEGKIDFLQTPLLDQLDRIEGVPGLRVERADEFRIIYLGLDQGSAELRSSDVKGANPFKDLRVRRAVYQAIDVEAIRAEVMHGLSSDRSTDPAEGQRLVGGTRPEAAV
jgi:ABC-type transport system substrate-binding protein